MEVKDKHITQLQMMKAIKAIVAGPKNEFIENVHSSAIGVTTEWLPDTEVQNQVFTTITLILGNQKIQIMSI